MSEEKSVSEHLSDKVKLQFNSLFMNKEWEPIINDAVDTLIQACVMKISELNHMVKMQQMQNMRPVPAAPASSASNTQAPAANDTAPDLPTTDPEKTLEQINDGEIKPEDLNKEPK